jgi:steroid delta-isomerase-like uncharacterized protein
MSVQENSEIIEKWFAVVNAQDYAGYVDLFSDDVVFRSNTTTEASIGKDAARQQLAGLFTAFPDYHIELKNAVVAEDQFVSEIEVSGTHKGELNLGPGTPSVPATGKQFRTQGIFVATVQDGKVSEVHTYPNIMGLMMQLGVMSPPSAE